MVFLYLVVLFIGSLGGLADKKNRLDLEALLIYILYTMKNWVMMESPFMGVCVKNLSLFATKNEAIFPLSTCS